MTNLGKKLIKESLRDFKKMLREDKKADKIIKKELKTDWESIQKIIGKK